MWFFFLTFWWPDYSGGHSHMTKFPWWQCTLVGTVHGGYGYTFHVDQIHKPGKSVNLLLLLVVVYLLLLLLHAFLTCAKSQQCASQVWLVGQQLDIQSFQMFESQ